MLAHPKALAKAGLALGGLALLAAAYLYFWCLMLENDCHLERDGSCEKLGRMLHLTAATGGVAVLLLIASSIVLFRTRRPSQTGPA